MAPKWFDHWTTWAGLTNTSSGVYGGQGGMKEKRQEKEKDKMMEIR